MFRPTRASIKLDSLVKNYLIIKGIIKEGVEVFPVVKADAYGHGALEVARKLRECGVEKFCVVMLEEALELIESGVHADYIILGGIFGGEDELVVKSGATPVIFRADEAERLDRAASRQGKKIKVHIKVDTGMGRIGVDSIDIFRFVENVARMKNVEVEGLLSHLSVADSDEEEDVRYTRDQLASFALIRKGLEEKGFKITYWHIANSSGLLRYPESHHNAVRPGIILYGCSPSPGVKIPAGLEPVLSLRSEITFLKRVPMGTAISYGRKRIVERDSLIATVPVGYADGISRRLPLDFEFLVKGKRAHIAGVVTMDMLMLDVTEIPGVSEGDEVVPIGRSGQDRIRAEDIAEAINTIPYEVLTSIGSRVPREYHAKVEERKE
jgi:alanine racemase